MRIRGDSAADDVAKELSNRFKQYRIACQITQEELADKSMVSLSTIKRFENGEENEVAVNMEWPFYSRQGFLNGRYAGDRLYSALRYRYALGQRLTAGVTAEKDDGEPMMKQGSGPFDSYSFYVNYTGEGTLRAVALGDYRVHVGQGLTAGSSYYSNAQSLVTSRRSRRQGFFPHASADEVNYLRGVGARPS